MIMPIYTSGDNDEKEKRYSQADRSRREQGDS